MYSIYSAGYVDGVDAYLVTDGYVIVGMILDFILNTTRVFICGWEIGTYLQRIFFT
jgi:hypothetical protein